MRRSAGFIFAASVGCVRMGAAAVAMPSSPREVPVGPTRGPRGRSKVSPARRSAEAGGHATALLIKQVDASSVRLAQAHVAGEDDEEREVARTRIVAVLLAALCELAAAAGGNFGTFVGQVETRWKEDGRRMELLSEFRYIDPDGVVWDAPKGWVIDGASIPQIAWSIAGGPYEGHYRPASVVHDVACDRKKRSWESVHLAFYKAMRAAGVGSRRAKVMYAAVYFFGPRWPFEKVAVVPDELVAEQSQGLRAELATKGEVAIEVRENYAVGVGATGQMEKIPTGMKDVVARVTPPVNRVSPEDFLRLKQRILAEDMSLERIREGNVMPK